MPLLAFNQWSNTISIIQLIRNKTEMVELKSTNSEQFIRTCIYITSHVPRKISNALLNSSTLNMYNVHVL